jgi:hypothetical protein
VYEAQKRHEWIGREYVQVRQSDHAGKKVAILGYGSIGRQSQFPLLSPHLLSLQVIDGDADFGGFGQLVE